MGILAVIAVLALAKPAMAADEPNWVSRAKAGETSWVDGFTVYGVGTAPKMANSSFRRSTAENRARQAAARADKGMKGASVKEISQEIWQSPDGALYVLVKIVRASETAAHENEKLAEGLDQSANFSIADRALELAAPLMTSSEARIMRRYFAYLKEKGLRLAEKAKKECSNPEMTEACPTAVLEANKEIEERFKMEKSFLQTLMGTTEGAREEIKKLLEKAKGTPI